MPTFLVAHVDAFVTVSAESGVSVAVGWTDDLLKTADVVRFSPAISSPEVLRGGVTGAGVTPIGLEGQRARRSDVQPASRVPSRPKGGEGGGEGWELRHYASPPLRDTRAGHPRAEDADLSTWFHIPFSGARLHPRWSRGVDHLTFFSSGVRLDDLIGAAPGLATALQRAVWAWRTLRPS
jgi:hypothetical protein